MSIVSQIKQIQSLITTTAEHCHRSPKDITLLAVSKGQSCANIQQAIDAGLMQFGENYLQEALSKISYFNNPALIWHFLGPIQSNKTHDIATHFDWVHSLTRVKIAQRLNEQRPANCQPLNVCIQVNVEGEASKSGITCEQILPLAKMIMTLPRLSLRGLMIIPASNKNAKETNAVFKELAQLKTHTEKQLAIKLDTLSMGMSDDIVEAISAGSTIVRIGRALFGERK